MRSSALVEEYEEDDADDEWMDADEEEEEDDWLGGGAWTFGSAPPQQVQLQDLPPKFSPTSSCRGAGGQWECRRKRGRAPPSGLQVGFYFPSLTAELFSSVVPT